MSFAAKRTGERLKAIVLAGICLALWPAVAAPSLAWAREAQAQAPVVIPPPPANFASGSFSVNGAQTLSSAPVYGPAPDWVTTISPGAAPTAGAQPLRVLLFDQQVRLTPDVTETYVQLALQAQTPQGLPAIGSITRSWDPQTETLTINRVQLLRAGKVIDVISPVPEGGGGRRFTVLRREENLEGSMLDGRLTATLQLEDVRVGDVLVFAVTVRRHDPSFRSWPEETFGQIPGLVTDRLYMRALWPKRLKVAWRTNEDLGQPKLTEGALDNELIVDRKAAKPPTPPRLAPPRFSEVGRLQISAYPSWVEASKSLSPLFAHAAAIAPSSPLHAEVQKIKSLSSDPVVQVSAALKLVEGDVRYLFLNDDLGGYKPVQADVTWKRRFGDCKGKTVLLVGLLRELGMEADPVLVSTTRGDGLPGHLPSLQLFNHAIVRLRLSGRTFWLDATRTGDVDLGRVHPPGYQWALPLTPGGSVLVPIDQAPFETPQSVFNLVLDARAGLTAPAPAHGEIIIRGDAAQALDVAIRQTTKADLDTRQREFWRAQFPNITIKTVSAVFDPSTGEARQSMDGVAELDWRADDQALGLRFLLSHATLGFPADFKRAPDTRQDAPYNVRFPTYEARSETLLLPEGGAGYSLIGRDIDRVVGAVHYSRTVEIKDGAAAAHTLIRSLAREFPANQIFTAQTGLNTLVGERVWVRAPVGYNLSKEELASSSALDPKTTEDFFRRGAEMMGKMETDKAIADFDEVLRREPAMGPALLARGLAWRRKGLLDRALLDFDAALAAQPDSLSALYARSQARLAAHRVDAALADANAAVRYAPSSIDAYNNRALLLQRIGRSSTAVADYDASLKINPDGSTALAGRARALRSLGELERAKADLHALGEGANSLNLRCFSRGGADLDLDLALSECDAALKLAPAAAHIYDSRGFANFRKGDMRAAEADMTTALKLNPKSAGSLYIRGLAKRALGEKAAGDADIKAAKALDATVTETFQDYGVKEGA